jgi:ATP-dependent DNA ligase
MSAANDPASTIPCVSSGRMRNICILPTAVQCDLSARIRPAVVSSAERPPEGLGCLHEVKHDGHRLAAILDGHGGLKLISRRGSLVSA